MKQIFDNDKAIQTKSFVIVKLWILGEGTSKTNNKQKTNK